MTTQATKLTKQLESIVKEVCDAASSGDGMAHIPIDLLNKLVLLAYNEGQLDAHQQDLTNIKTAYAKVLQAELDGHLKK